MTTTAAQWLKQFINTVQHDLRYYDELHVLLKKQRALYIGFDAEKLSLNTQQQSVCLIKLQESARQRKYCLQQLKLTNNEEGVNKLFSILPSHIRNPMNVQWQKLENLIKMCQKQNIENGQISAGFHEMIGGLSAAKSLTYQEEIFT